MTSGYRMVGHKPAELFRADLISAMKLPDSIPMEQGSFVTIKEPWRTEWEVGVQVCVSPDQMPEARARSINDHPEHEDEFRLPPVRFSESSSSDSQYVPYDLDDLDLNWLEAINQKRKYRALAGPDGITEESLMEAITFLETKCQQNMARAVATEESLGIEYDEQTACDICRDHEGEESNAMIFCDSCNVCVHQACYGVRSIPRGDWLCKSCTIGEKNPPCMLCPNTGGALKRVKPGNTSWAHLSCALWIPEVRIGNTDKMEPITNVDVIPASRWNLVCCICRKKQGACIQCSHPSCVIAYHVTCGFQNSLEMKSRLDVLNNGVIHESFCPKHSLLRKSPSKRLKSPLQNDMNKPSQLLHLQESFHKYATADELTEELKLPPKLSAILYNYWKLKRKSLHNRPLLSHLPIEASIESIESIRAGFLRTEYGMEFDENFTKVIHIRHNLEKARNLVYMVQKRERMKKQILRGQAELFQLESTLLEEEAEEAEERERERERERQEQEILLAQSVRQTRSMAQKEELAGTGSTSVATCNHVGHSNPSVVTMNGPTAMDSSPPESPNGGGSGSVLNSHGCRNVRRRDVLSPGRQLQGHVNIAAATDVSHLVRPKLRRRFSDGDMVGKTIVDGNGDELVFTSGPARNLRHRPYTVSKSTKS